ncbi:MAG TPA: APC family permease [Gemmatimonadaceae bacterium]|nr:APC family permease [Gemmatimonadaceae bacterium]
MPAPSAQAGERTLVRALGVRALAATTFNVMIGSGIFVLPAIAAGMMGAAAPVAYVACALAMGLIVLCFAEAGSRVSLTGGPYAYVGVALGPFVGFLSGVLLWLLTLFATAAVASALAGAAAVFWAPLGAGVPRTLFLAAVFALLAWINVRGVRQGTRVVEVVTVAKLLPLILLVAVGFFVAPAASTPVVVEPRVLGRTMVILIFAFAGVESALVPSGEVRDPARTVPRALAIAMVVVTLLYVAIQLVAQRALGVAALAAAHDAGLSEAARRIAGPVGGTLLAAGAVVSMLGHVSGMTLATPRALYALGRDGFIPGASRAIAAVHPRWRTPWVAILVHVTIAATLAISSSFAPLAILANVSVLVLYLLCCVAAFELRRRDVRAGGTPFRVPGGAAVPVAAAVVIVWILAHATVREFAVVGAVLCVATLLYVATAPARRRPLASASES